MDREATQRATAKRESNSRWKIDYHLVALVDIGIELDKRLHGFDLAIQRSDENRYLAVSNTMDINVMGPTQPKANSKNGDHTRDIDCLIVALVDIGVKLDESFHRFKPAIQASNENRSFALHITININAVT